MKYIYVGSIGSALGQEVIITAIEGDKYYGQYIDVMFFRTRGLFFKDELKPKYEIKNKPKIESVSSKEEK